MWFLNRGHYCFEKNGGQLSIVEVFEQNGQLCLRFKPTLDLNGEPETCLEMQRANLPSSSVFPSLLLSLTEETQRYTSYRQEIPPCKSLPGLPLSVSSSSLHTKRTCTLSSHPLHSPLSSVTFPMYGEEGR